MKKVSRDYADENFDQRDRNTYSDRDQTRDQRERHPNCSDEPHVLKDDVGRTETEPNVVKHKKTPVCALTTHPGVISSENRQRSFPEIRKANSIARNALKPNSRSQQGIVFGFRRNFQALRSTS